MPRYLLEQPVFLTLARRHATYTLWLCAAYFTLNVRHVVAAAAVLVVLAIDACRR